MSYGLPTDGQLPGSDNAGGFYDPAQRPYPIKPNYQEWQNSNNGILDVQTRDAIHNLISELPLLKTENLTLAGEQAVWLRRLRFGTQCPNWNDSTQECGRAKCNFCYNTGILGGYETGTGLILSFIPGKADIRVEEVGLTVTQKPQAWCGITDPVISEQDIIVVYSNERYEVHSAEAIELQGKRYYQELTLSRIDQFDAKYNVPVPGIFLKIMLILHVT